MIAKAELVEVTDFVKANGLSEQVLGELRKKYHDRHFTWCTEDDINAGKPVFECESFHLYLVNSADHCSVLTNDMESASGYVFAELIDD